MYPYLSYKGRGSSWVEMRRQRPTATPEDFNGLVQLQVVRSFRGYVSILLLLLYTEYSQQSFMSITGRRMSGCYTCYKIKMDCLEL